MPDLIDLEAAINADGFAIIESVLDADEVVALINALEHTQNAASTLRLHGEAFAMRNLLQTVPQIRALADSLKVRSIAASVLGNECRPVRGILFDKVNGANWKVPWHQDVTIAVAERVEAEGFGPWSTKSEVQHVQPPAWVLESMVSVRLHLDECSESNGALRVIAGSHLNGKIREEDIPDARAAGREIVCSVARGGVLLMRPLLLHAPSPSRNPAHRRVIHSDYASAKLPSGMQWHAEAS